MIKLLKNAEVYAPQYLGQKDILVVSDKICRLADKIEGYDNLPEVEVIDLSGKKLVPGYIDMHVHITGGGGEQGPASRVPEAQLSEFLKNGITTVVGLLGTDGITRSLENLVAKARALTEEGITAYCLTSSYRCPSHTITESVEKDIVMIPPMIGVKIAVSDHRSSYPTREDLIRLGSQARRAGMLSNTAGLVTMHMGDGKGGLDPLFYALDNSDIPAKHFLPTHVGRKMELVDQGAELVRRGGFIDFTAGSSDEEVPEMVEKILYCLGKDGVDIDHITLSSDAFGSQPRFNERRECIGLTYASPKFLHKTIQELVRRGIALEEALKLLTVNPAEILNKRGVKGCIAEGADADLLVLDVELNIDSLLAKGQIGLLDGQLKMRGRFE